MEERQWTGEQLSAINTRDRTLLVSAAAGSGKTATLTERIIRSLTDPENPTDISSLLIVTFTNAAARELRAKIAAALEGACAANPTNEHLSRQLYLLPSAKIRTIDSFCNDILRANSDRVGIPPNYRIADTAEIELLAQSILGGLIEAVYEGHEPSIASPEDFERLADCLTDSKRIEELFEVFEFVFMRLESTEAGIDTLVPLIEKYNPEKFTEIDECEYAVYLLSRVSDMLAYHISVTEKYVRKLTDGNDVEKKYLELASDDLDKLRRLQSCGGYNALRNAYSLLKFKDAPRGVANDAKTDAVNGYMLVRQMMKKDVLDQKEYFLYTEEDWRSLFCELYSLLSVFYRFEKRYGELFAEEKIRKGAFSYADIERYCYNCLIKDGERTDIAKNLEKQFTAIYIDEYQDVNSLQNRIFEAIARPDNRFMVGDIKQSIYGFRSACPEIFAQMKAAFPPYEEGKYSTASSIFMSNNFRCDKGVVDFVNGIFDKAFSLMGESIGYVDGDRLKYSKVHKGGEPPYESPKIYMIDKGAELSEAEAVAYKIRDILENGRLDDGSAVRPCDIAILLRSAKDRDVRYAEALRSLGIASEITADKDFFLSSEVLLVLCMLNSIDNPRRDIYLAGLMCSPIFRFEADELYEIRCEGDGDTLYESLCSYVAKNPGFEKGLKFLGELSHYREVSEGLSTDALLYKLYYETGLMALAAANGGKENLTVLYDYARGYEAGSYKGLYNFIAFINNLIDKKTTFDDNRGGGDESAVKIVTCHSSKGLEYPIVFLTETGSRMTNKDSRKRLVFDESFGICFRTRTPSGLALVENPVRRLILDYIFDKNYEEELRVLYVALTRAREKLYVTGTSPTEKREEYEAKISALRENLSSYSVRRLSSLLEIMLVTGECPSLLGTADLVGAVDHSDGSPEPDYEEPETPDLGELSGILSERFNYEYPYAHMTELPEKMSVSNTTPTVLDDVDGGIALFDVEEDGGREILPRFISGHEMDESARRGIATHYFMQFCDLDSIALNGAKYELERLVREGFVSKRDGERVRIREIEAFARSELFSDMRSATHVWREFRFNTRLPAVIFTTEEEKKLAYSDKYVFVQGVIDCIVEYKDGTIGLFDYKTDRLSREELADPSLAEATLRAKHELQLYYYSLAIENIFGKAPSRVEVYSLALGRGVDVKHRG